MLTFKFSFKILKLLGIYRRAGKIYMRAVEEKRNLSQMELSYESGVSQNMITYIEIGKRTPAINTILKLCIAMKISPALLFPQNISDRQEAKLKVLELVEKFM